MCGAGEAARGHHRHPGQGCSVQVPNPPHPDPPDPRNPPDRDPPHPLDPVKPYRLPNGEGTRTDIVTLLRDR